MPEGRVGGRQGGESEEAAAEQMRALLEPFLLRRLKTDVATQLAAKSQQVPPSPLCTPPCAAIGRLKWLPLWGRQGTP